MFKLDSHWKRTNEETHGYLCSHQKVRFDLIRSYLEDLITLSHTVDTLSVMMYPRFKDNSLHGFRNWNLTSIHFWGEDPIGIWRLYIQNVVSIFSYRREIEIKFSIFFQQKSMGPARLLNVELILHGITKPGGCFRKKPFRRYLDEELIQKVITKVPVSSIELLRCE